MSGRFTRRAFLAGAGSAAAACAGGKLPAPSYPAAQRCAPGGCTRVDVHCHVFNGSDLNVKGFVTHVLPLPRKLTAPFAERLHQTVDAVAPSGAEEFAQLPAIEASRTLVRRPARGEVPAALRELANVLAAQAQLSEVAVTAERMLETLELGLHPRREVAAALVELYPQIDLFTPAMVDYGYWSRDETETPLADQLQVQAAVARLSMAGLIGRPEARVHPLAPFNPLREVREAIEGHASYTPFGPASAWKEGAAYTCDGELPAAELPKTGALGPLRHAVERLGFLGVKVYPPTGFLPIGNAEWVHHQQTGLGVSLDRALRAFYAYCEAEQVPVMTHGNDSNGYDAGYGLLTGPDQWARVLAEFPNLRLNLGHFGGLEGYDAELGIEGCELWMRQIADLMERYPHVYADSGYSLVHVENEFHDRYIDLLDDLFEEYPKAKQRFMYGSDFWLNGLAANQKGAFDSFDGIFRKHFAEAADDFLGHNALRFLGLLDDAGDKPRDGRNRKRLQAFYAGLAAPAWLAAS